MAGVWQEAIVRLRRDDRVTGTGALVRTVQDGCCVLTCAHVVNAILRRDELYAAPRPDAGTVITFDLPVKSQTRTYEARILEWFPPRRTEERIDHPISDIALLKVVSELPGDLRPFRPEQFRVADLDRMKVRSFGFSKDTGTFANGSLMSAGGDAAGWLDFSGESELQSFVAPGFSGAPLFDETLQTILGMVVAVDTRDGQRMAFAQSTINLWKGCPQLARPYPGLRDFEEDDAPYFYGRDTFVEQLVDKLKDHPIVGVTAASGAGKSSVIKAGLIPRLRREQTGLIVKMRPQDDPWRDLARQLVPMLHPGADPGTLVDKAEELRDKLVEKPERLKEYGAQLLASRPGFDRLIILVDQFEELFTLAGHEAGVGQPAPRRQHDFRDLMVATAGIETEPRIQWIYALRGDFADRAFRHRAFVDRLGGGDVKLADMTANEVREAIRKPAETLDVGFEAGTGAEPGLAERIAMDAGAATGSLPLMQHVLARLWERMQERRLTHAAYDGMGRLAGALNQHADEVYARLTAEEQRLAQKLFYRLVAVGESGEPTRRIASRTDVGEEVWRVARRLAEEDNRLVVIRGGEDQADTVEVAHEALIRNWKRLENWIRDDLRFLLWRQQLETQMKVARQHDDAPETLLAGSLLTEAMSWLTTRPDDLHRAERSFIEASRAADEEQRRREKAAEEKQLRSLRTQRMAFIALLVMAVAAGVIGYLYQDATNARNQAVSARDQAEIDASRYAAAIGGQLLANDDPVEALQVVRASLSGKFSPKSLAKKKTAYAELGVVLRRLEQELRNPSRSPGPRHVRRLLSGRVPHRDSLHGRHRAGLGRCGRRRAVRAGGARGSGCQCAFFTGWGAHRHGVARQDFPPLGRQNRSRVACTGGPHRGGQYCRVLAGREPHRHGI